MLKSHFIQKIKSKIKLKHQPHNMLSRFEKKNIKNYQVREEKIVEFFNTTEQPKKFVCNRRMLFNN